MKDILFQLLFILIFAFVLLGVSTLVSGCRFVQPIVDFVFAPSNSVPIVDPVSPQGQLLNAVKGTNWLVSLSILGMAAGVFAFINGSKIGIPVVIACAVALFMSLAVARFAWWMAIFGLMGAVVAVAISILVKQRALKEVIGNIQGIKSIVKNPSPIQLSVDSNGPTLQTQISEVLSKQTKSTRKLVKKIRSKIEAKEAKEV